jgi:hypothetical protein
MINRILIIKNKYNTLEDTLVMIVMFFRSLIHNNKPNTNNISAKKPYAIPLPKKIYKAKVNVKIYLYNGITLFT